jgi:SAM-dependent methyltransferase
VDTQLTTTTAHPGLQASRGRVADIFNSTVAGFAVAAAWETGALDELRERDTLAVGTFCADRDLHVPSVRSMFAALAAAGIVVRDGDIVSTGPEFAAVYRHKAFFHWLTVGCAELFANMSTIAHNEARVGSFYRRDAAAIGFACRDINLYSFDPVFWQAMAELDFDFTVVADLGCGSGGRLAQIADRYPGITGVGVDIAPAALREAREYVAATGFGDRFTFIEGDARAIEPDPRFVDVEVLTCFMMGHDFWPRERCVTSLRRLRDAFPNVRRFLLGDTARTVGFPDRDKPVFTLAFETAHDLMGVYLPTLAEWADVFAESGWKCMNVREVVHPADSVIYELA